MNEKSISLKKISYLIQQKKKDIRSVMVFKIFGLYVQAWTISYPGNYSL